MISSPVIAAVLVGEAVSTMKLTICLAKGEDGTTELAPVATMILALSALAIVVKATRMVEREEEEDKKAKVKKPSFRQTIEGCLLKIK